MTTSPLYPPEDQPEVLRQCAEAYNVVSKLTNPCPAIVCRFSGPEYTRPHYGFRFDPRKKQKIGDVLPLQYGATALIIAIVTTEENPTP